MVPVESGDMCEFTCDFVHTNPSSIIKVTLHVACIAVTIAPMFNYLYYVPRFKKIDPRVLMELEEYSGHFRVKHIVIAYVCDLKSCTNKDLHESSYKVALDPLFISTTFNS